MTAIMDQLGEGIRRLVVEPNKMIAQLGLRCKA